MRYDDLNSYDLIRLLLEDNKNLPRMVKCFVLLLTIYSSPFEENSLKNIQRYIDTKNVSIIWDEMANIPNARIENLIYGIATNNPSYLHYCYSLIVGLYNMSADDSRIYQFSKPSKMIACDPAKCVCFRNILEMEFGKSLLRSHYKIIDETLSIV